MPRLTRTGLAPAAMAFMPWRTIPWAITVAGFLAEAQFLGHRSVLLRGCGFPGRSRRGGWGWGGRRGGVPRRPGRLGDEDRAAADPAGVEIGQRLGRLGQRVGPCVQGDL